MSAQSFNENRSQYLSEYLQKTLGVSQILNQNSEQSINANLTTEPSVDLGFFIEEYATYSEAEKDLLQKMISAMKLRENQYQIFALSEMNNIQSKFKIIFVNEPKNEEQIYSPRNLLVHPENKKNTWEFLKKMMSKCLFLKVRNFKKRKLSIYVFGLLCLDVICLMSMSSIFMLRYNFSSIFKT
jgi:hypothetical protein